MMKRCNFSQLLSLEPRNPVCGGRLSSIRLAAVLLLSALLVVSCQKENSGSEPTPAGDPASSGGDSAGNAAGDGTGKDGGSGLPVATCPAKGKASAGKYGKDVCLAEGAGAVFSDGLSIMLVDLSDSRCPAHMECQQGGTMKAVVRIVDDKKEKRDLVFLANDDGSIETATKRQALGVDVELDLTSASIPATEVKLVVKKSQDMAAVADPHRFQVTGCSLEPAEAPYSRLTVTGRDKKSGDRLTAVTLIREAAGGQMTVFQSQDESRGVEVIQGDTVLRTFDAGLACGMEAQHKAGADAKVVGLLVCTDPMSFSSVWEFACSLP